MSKVARMTQEQSELSAGSLKKQYSEMSQKEKFKFFISCLVITVCACGLLFQLFLLFRQFYSGRTVVNVQIEITKFNKIPAITICYPNLISMDLAAQKYPELSPLFDNYKTLVFNNTEDTPSIQEFQEQVYGVYENFTKEVKNLDLTAKEIFDISIPFKFPILSDVPWFNSTVPISIVIKGIRYFRNNNTMTDIELEDRSPIESISIGEDSYKCFTFFHRLNIEYRSYQIDEKEVMIEIYHNQNWFPAISYEKPSKFIMFSMHSPNTFPQQVNGNNFLRLKAGKWYEITYNRLKTVLLPPPYQTQCMSYDLDDQQNYKLRSDCISDCIDKRLGEACLGRNITETMTKDKDQTDCFYSYDGLWRRDVLAKYNQSSDKLCSNSSVNVCFDHNINRVNRECQVTCKVECDNRFYNYNMKTNNKLENNRSYTLIKIEHNQLPDQITEHMEEMSFIQFVASFGGLTGMWLGLSVVVIPLYFLKFL